MKLTFVSLLCIKITAKIISKPFFLGNITKLLKFHKLMTTESHL